MICKKCGNEFPCKMIIDGKEKFLHRRSYCLDCSPFGSRKGYDLRKEKSREKGPRKKYCTKCNRQFEWTKNNVCSTCRNRDRRHLNKLELVKIKGSKCVECGENDFRCLQFHHTDPENKNFTISHSLHLAFDKLAEEANKCILLCANCHAKHHHSGH